MRPSDISCTRLMHIPSLVALRLSLGCETWPPFDWYHPFVISWSRYKLGLPQPWGLGADITTKNFVQYFQRPLTVSLHRQNCRLFASCWGCAGRLWNSLHLDWTKAIAKNNFKRIVKVYKCICLWRWKVYNSFWKKKISSKQISFAWKICKWPLPLHLSRTSLILIQKINTN